MIQNAGLMDEVWRSYPSDTQISLTSAAVPAWVCQTQFCRQRSTVSSLITIVQSLRHSLWHSFPLFLSESISPLSLHSLSPFPPPSLTLLTLLSDLRPQDLHNLLSGCLSPPTVHLFIILTYFLMFSLYHRHHHQDVLPNKVSGLSVITIISNSWAAGGQMCGCVVLSPFCLH